MIAVQLNWGQFTRRAPELLPPKVARAVARRFAREARVRRWRARSIAPGPKGRAIVGSGGGIDMIESRVDSERGSPQLGE